MKNTFRSASFTSSSWYNKLDFHIKVKKKFFSKIIISNSDIFYDEQSVIEIFVEIKPAKF